MRYNQTLRLFLVMLLGFSLVMITGCQGCRDDDKDKTEEEKKKEEEEKKEREKPNFETEAAVVYPGNYSDVTRNNTSKQGHWVTVDYRLTANKFDTQGNLTANSTTPSMSSVPIENTDYFAVASRPFSVTKSEPKNLATNVYLPRRTKGSFANVQFNMQRNSGGLAQFTEVHGVRLMRPHQYHMVLLTNRADAYRYIKVIDSVKFLIPDTGGRAHKFYEVVATRPDEEPIALPRQSLFWTTIAYVIWDDLDVDQLDEQQQQALLDWLHYGGQLILSGPDCLDQLSNSFLADFLPAKITSSRNFTREDFAAINEHWSIKAKNLELQSNLVVNKDSPIIGVDLELQPKASFVQNTGKIVAERAVGRGRIVATAFSMDDKPVWRWASYPSFFNGALLRRPARRFGNTPDGLLSFCWVNDATTIFDPLLGSTLRYLSRDLVHRVSNHTQTVSATPGNAQVTTEMISGFGFQNNDLSGAYPDQFDSERFRTTDADRQESRNLEDHWHYGGFNHDSRSGTAGWNDESGISAAARDTLRQAAGISPPSSEFVLKMLSIYLLVLVPANWLFFRAIGRVEWAWIAAPFIAIAGAFMVAKMASLDIGFVRSNSQVACLEVHADYPRAHLAQYSALYTSLSTGYDLELDDMSAVALPLGDRYRKKEETTIKPVTIRQTIKNRLEDFQVQSNSTGMLHTEMMHDMQGVFSWVQDTGPFRVDNGTKLNLAEAAVLRRINGNLESAWIGDLPEASSSPELKFEQISQASDPWNRSSVLITQLQAEDYWNRLEELHEVDVDGTVAVRVKNIRAQVPELQDKWSEFTRFLIQQPDPSGADSLEERLVKYETFRTIMKRIDKVKSVNVSALFRQVANNLALAEGEVRLIAVSDQSIGNNRFNPASTQTQQQTLVVVHLRRPKFETPRLDTNTVADFTKGRSDLDWLDEEAEFDALEEDLLDEEDE